MLNRWKQNLSAMRNAQRFTAFYQGCDLKLSTGAVLRVTAKATYRSPRPVGLRFARHAFITEVSAGDQTMTGFGEDSSKLLAISKSIAEGVERVVFKHYKAQGLGTVTSNGWAAHLSPEQAHQSAVEELIERDAVLSHWLCQIPMLEVSEPSWPKWLKAWTANELSLGTKYRRLRVLVSTKGYLPSVTTVLCSEQGHAVMSHASDGRLENAVSKALVETCRIAELSEFPETVQSAKSLLDGASSGWTPEDHAYVYAHHLAFPEWIFGETLSWSEIQATWNDSYSSFKREAFEHSFELAADGALSVGFCTSKKVQTLFFGPTHDAKSQGLLNVARLGKIASSEDWNFLPHCIA